MKIWNRIRRLALTLVRAKREFSFIEVVSFLRLRRRRSGVKTHRQNRLHSFIPRKLAGQVVLIREGTTDIGVLEDVICHGYYLPPHPLEKCLVIVDLGANIGCGTAHFAALYPEATVIAVELDEENAEMARRNNSSFGNRVRILNAAVWSEDGEVDYEGSDADAFHVISGAHGTRQVRAITMPTLMKEFAIERIDYLKVDIEGAERALFCECDPSWLNRVFSIKIEIHEESMFSPIIDVLRKYGFVVAKDQAHWSCVAGWRKT